MSIVRDTDFRRRLPVHSMMRMYPIVYETSDRERFLNIFRSVTRIQGQTDYFLFEEYVTNEEDWFDLISYRFYGTPNLWWVVAVMNDVVNPFEYLDVGISIQVLKSDYLFLIYDSLHELEKL